MLRIEQFQYCVIIFQTSFIDFRCFGGCLILPILRWVVNRRSKFVDLCHSYSNFFVRFFYEIGSWFYVPVWKFTERYDKRKPISEVA